MSRSPHAPEPCDLHALEAWMQAALMAPHETDPQRIHALLEDSARLDAAGRLAIYQRSYHARLLECMNHQFPALRHALGAELFADFAGEYLRACPSRSHTLHQLGARFPHYLEQQRPDQELPAEQREGWIDFMVDLARFEYTIAEMFDRPGCEGQTHACKSTPDEQLALQPCLSLCSTRYPVAEYYHQVRAQLDPSFPTGEASNYLLVRKDFQIRTLSLRPTQHWFFTAMLEGLGVDEALAFVATHERLPLAQVRDAWRSGSSRGNWLAAGVFLPAHSR